MGGWIYVVAVVVVVAAVSYFLTTQGSKTSDGAPMPDRWRRVLVVYLLSVGFVLMFMLVSLTSVEFPNTLVDLAQQRPSPSTPTEAAAGTAPQLVELAWQTTADAPPTTTILIYGQNFTAASAVRFNRLEVAKFFVSSNLLKAPLSTENVLSQGPMIIDVVNGNVGSNALVLNLSKPRVPLNVFRWWHPYITLEVQLFLLVLCAGALGSFIHGLKSLADFIGNRTLTASWFWWYITRPFLGMAMALVFYSLLRGGFLAGTPADARIVNPFGVIAVGALVGMFADKAAQKLAEIFETLFKSADPRSDKLNTPVIDRIEPERIAAGTKVAVLLKISGDRLGTVSAVRLNAEERKPETVTEQQVTVKLRPEDLKDARQIKVTAVNTEGTVSTDATLDIVASDLTTSTAALNGAIVNTPYTFALTATGGTPPYKWAITSGPPWLAIDEGTGTLQGTPTAAGTATVVVRLVDASGITTTSPELTLSIT
ncbi:MAG TPA: Ig domain-containing protein [Vicinamibacterales bacterium]|jgi:Putative Ig domain|nr:Ig domain-containing protein [Vicinamibacterales bacterium]